MVLSRSLLFGVHSGLDALRAEGHEVCTKLSAGTLGNRQGLFNGTDLRHQANAPALLGVLGAEANHSLDLLDRCFVVEGVGARREWPLNHLGHSGAAGSDGGGPLHGIRKNAEMQVLQVANARDVVRVCKALPEAPPRHGQETQKRQVAHKGEQQGEGVR